jgi:cell division protease FtsH
MDATPRSPSPIRPLAAVPVADARLSPIPTHAAEVLSRLANLIDESITIRGTGIGVRDWAAAFLGLAPTEVAVTSADPSLLDSQLMALAFADDLATHAPLETIGSDQEEAPDWVKLELGEVTDRVPCELAARFPAGSLVEPPLVVQVCRPYHASGLVFRSYSRHGDTAVAEAYLDSLRDRSRARTNPFRNRVLETTTSQLGLTFRVVTPSTTTRDDVVLPPSVWAALDRNVHGLYAALDRLAAAGLATNRGVLLEGPPGTGKTALCRALANELAGSVTVIFCDAATVANGVRQLYRELEHLAPALVVMEDVDLVVGDRSAGSGPALLDFLVALDGAMSGHNGVVTIATTNDPRAIDPAAKRSARFDVLIEVPAPDATGRAEILRRYLRDLGEATASGIDVDRVAAATPGMTGADLRELVSDAVLHLTAPSALDEVEAPPLLTTALLVGLARDRRQRPVPGLYL